MKRLLVLTLVATGALFMGGRAALACSCAMGDPRTSLARSDAAFVGRLVSREAPKGEGNGVYSSAEQVTYTFSVERSVKGDLGKTVDVESAANGASCGIEAGVGQRIGMLLTRSGDQWNGSLCSQMDPDVLIRAAGPLPKPDGAGPVRFLLGGQFGEARVMALDSQMRLLGYGFGEGEVTGLAVCPSSRRAVEVANKREGPDELTHIVLAVVRDLASLRVVSETQIRLFSGTINESDFSVLRVSCRDAEGTDLLLFGINNIGQESGRLVRLSGGRETTVYEGPGTDVLFGPGDIVYQAAANQIYRVDVASGRAQTIATRTGNLSQTWSLSPDGRWIAGVYTDYERTPTASKLVLVELTSGAARVRSAGLEGEDLGGPTAWVDVSTFLIAPGNGTLQLFDTSFRKRGTIKGWEGGHGLVVVGSEAFGSGWGWLGSATLPSGSARTLRRLDSTSMYALVAVDDGHEAAPETPQPSPVAAQAPAPPGRDAPITAAVVLLAAVGLAGWRLTRRPAGSGAGDRS